MNNVTKELDAMCYSTGTGETIADKIATGYGMTYTYNLAGMRVTELDPESAALGLSWSMRYIYDAIGRLIRTENIEGTIACTEYDRAGNVVRQTVRESPASPSTTGNPRTPYRINGFNADES